MEIEVIDGKREGSAIYHCGDGYYYHYNNGNLYNENEALVLNLRCRKYNQLGCAGSAKIVIVEGENIMEWTNRQPHVCARDRTHHAVLDLRRNILQEASQLNGPYEAPSTVVNRVRNNGYDPNVAALVTVSRMKSAIHRARSHLYPNVPVSLFQLGELLNDRQNAHLTNSLDGRDNIYGGAVQTAHGTAVIFISRRMRRYMRRVKTVFCDGTFKSRPNQPNSAQVLQILANVNNTVIPLAQILMPSKDQADYTAVLRRIQEMVPQFRPRRVMTDFEIGLQNAWRDVFGCHVYGCYWHYCRAVLLKAQELHLYPTMRANRRLNSLVRSLLGIPLLPQNLMLRGFDTLVQEARRRNLFAILDPLFTYYANFWFSPAVFQSLSVYGLKHRTNNIAESANRLLRSRTGAHRPGLWHFLFALRQNEQSTALLLRTGRFGLDLNRKRRVSAVTNDRRIRNFTLNLFNGNISINRFLHSVSCRVLAFYNRLLN